MEEQRKEKILHYVLLVFQAVQKKGRVYLFRSEGKAVHGSGRRMMRKGNTGLYKPIDTTF